MSKIKFRELEGLERYIMRTRPDLIDLKLRGDVWLLPNSNNYPRPEAGQAQEEDEQGQEPPPITIRRIDSATEIKTN